MTTSLKNTFIKKTVITILLFLCGLHINAENPKREFRGAWMHVIFQDQYHRHSTEQNKKYLREQLDILKKAGINAIIFQIRPQADALYPSKLEPWSRFLTDNGKAPSPYWDPLQFMIEEAHCRGMELHAWLNPYRVTSAKNQTLPANHIYHKHPEWFVRYDDKLYFDPGLPESRQFITDVVMDIITRYDVDGIHFDDYFYPYPVKGKEFPDSKSYAKYGKGMELGDWRRKNVDILIRNLHEKISETKPWVIFGISPFGIWRNKSSDPRGSDTNGLQNYDSLFADVILWAREGWIDYLLPQLYWELDHKSAPYLTLVDWWNDNAEGRNLYIGQSVTNIMKNSDSNYSEDATQLRHKIKLSRSLENIGGNCWWPAYEITKNNGGVADSLINDHQSTIALNPTYPWISENKPDEVKNVRYSSGVLTWDTPKKHNQPDDAVKFVVYRFDKGEEINLEKPEAIECVTWVPSFKPKRSGIYVVTSLSRVNQESWPSNEVDITIK